MAGSIYPGDLAQPILPALVCVDIGMQSKYIFSLLILLLSCTAIACAQQPITPMDLDAYKWKNRLVIIFSPDEANAAYLSQKEMLHAQKSKLNERDMVVIVLVGEDKVYVNGKLQQEKQAQTIRGQYQISLDSFTVLLLGKDGTEKLRRSQPVEPEELFGLIDQMPMRRQEMRINKN